MFRTDAQMQDFFNANKGVWPNPVLSLAEILGNLSSNLNLFLKTQLKGNVKNQLKKAIDDAIDEVRRQTASDFNTFFFLPKFLYRRMYYFYSFFLALVHCKIWGSPHPPMGTILLLHLTPAY